MTTPKSILVVGASSGLGAALALEHARIGDNVTAVARRGDRLDELARFTPNPDQWSSVRLDITAADAISRMTNYRPTADVVYLVAGVNSSDPDVIMRTNLIGPIQIAEAYAGHVSTIVVISSVAAVVQFPGLAAYGASKAGLEHWARTFAQSTTSQILVVRPGQFASEFFEPREKLVVGDLPFARAKEVLDKVARSERSQTMTLGARRDALSASMSRIVGSRLARKFL